MKTKIFIVIIMAYCLSSFGQSPTWYAKKSINNDSIKIEVMIREGIHYWVITNEKYPKIVIGSTSSEYTESHNGPAPLTQGDTLQKGQSKICPIDFFSKNDKNKFPYFLLKYQGFGNNDTDYFVQFCDDKGPVSGKIVVY